MKGPRKRAPKKYRSTTLIGVKYPQVPIYTAIFVGPHYTIIEVKSTQLPIYTAILRGPITLFTTIVEAHLVNKLSFHRPFWTRAPQTTEDSQSSALSRGKHSNKGLPDFFRSTGEDLTGITIEDEIEDRFPVSSNKVWDNSYI